MNSAWGRNQCAQRAAENWSPFSGELPMASNDRSRKSSRREPHQQKPSTDKVEADRPFDMWLHKQLHAMYDEIASEPLPGDLLKLIDSDAAQAGDPLPAPDRADTDTNK
jgi:hypothetical protein